MKRYKGGDEVKPGFYVNRGAWRVETISGKRRTLPGDDVDVYIRVPGLAVLLIAPLMGAVFAFFLPFIGIALLVTVGAKNVVRRFNPPPTPLPPREEAKAIDAEAVASMTRKAA